MGLGRRLLREAVAFCRGCRYEYIFLRSYRALTAASHLLGSFGFEKTAEQPSERWGVAAIEEWYVLYPEITAREAYSKQEHVRDDNTMANGNCCLLERYVLQIHKGGTPFTGSQFMSATEEIYRRVVRVLAESLYVDEGELTPTATLKGDLGAESLDFLEIVFRLEHDLGIDIPEGDLFPRSVLQGNPDFVRGGQLTDQGMSELRSRMPYADLGDFDQNRQLSTITDLFAVGLVARYIAWKLDKCAGAGRAGSVELRSNKMHHPHARNRHPTFWQDPLPLASLSSSSERQRPLTITSLRCGFLNHPHTNKTNELMQFGSSVLLRTNWGCNILQFCLDLFFSGQVAFGDTKGGEMGSGC